MYRLSLICLLLCAALTGTVRAGDRDTLSADFSRPVDGLDIRHYLSVYTGNATASQAQGLDYRHDTSIFHRHKKLLFQENDAWFRLTIRNTGPVDSVLYLFAGWQERLFFYSEDASGALRHETSAGMMLHQQGADRWDSYAFPLHVAAGQARTFYLHLENPYYRENELMPVLYDAIHYAHFRHRQADRFKGEALVIQIVIGMLLVLLSITIINYIQLPDKPSMYFSAYLLGLILFFCLRLETKPYQLSFFHSMPMLKYYWDVPALISCFYFMSMLFGRAFLNLRERFPLMDKYYFYSNIFYGACIAACIVLMWMGDYTLPGQIFTWATFLSLIPFGISFVALGRRMRHHPLIRFFLYGSLGLYLLAIWSFFRNTEPVPFTPLPELITPYSLLVVGVLVQSLSYAAGLSYRNKLVHQEKTRTQELLIKQLNKNKELQRKLNEQLEELVREQTTEIVRRKTELEEQRKLQMEAEYSKKFAEIELKAIRAQINPHFIFNCLNSIQLFVMQRDYEHAQKYLSDFSYLIRKTLDFSRRNFISLADEITYLNTYLGLEKMRFEQKMSFEILMDPTLNTVELEVPAMLLQPYVENAVKYGMTNEEHTTGLLTIRFTMIAHDMLECIVEDNGLGITRSRQLRTLPGHHQSSGMEISFNRAELLNKMYNTGIQIEIIDKSTRGTQESGTIVKVLIPQL
ncbi:histidine kinase [Chitinophaga pollutisoli]|uniref:Histidine kinase n=1 Tax=Chitinophaga pollutisoli TaxID=3133966 RepID=A0ABZ2YV24_9BACT